MLKCDWKQIIAHVDMDAFFAQIEERDHPWLKGKPLIIGGAVGQRGVASTCNYEARKFGVHAGMPLNECQKLCPHAVFMRTRGEKYSYTSLQVLSVLQEFSQKVDMTSIDEGYLDMTSHRRLYPDLKAMAEAIKRGVWNRVNLTCSVGIAPNRYVAKMCVGENKPNGITVMSLEEYRQKFAPRPVSKLIGVGESTEKALAQLGIKTVGQLQRFPENILKARFGIYGPRLKEMANGEYEGTVSIPYAREQVDKSVGHERTFQHDVQDREIIITTLHKLSCKAARRLRQGNFQGKRVTLKLRYSDFSTFTHQTTLNYFTNDEDEIFHEAVKCFEESYNEGKAVRLIGVRVSHLGKTEDCYSALQGDLFKGAFALKKRCVLKAADEIRDKFGEKALFYGRSGG